MSLKTAVKKALYTTGYYHYKCRQNQSVDERLLIIMYHDLANDGAHEQDWTQRAEPTVSQFRSQLIKLRKCARTLTVSQAMSEIEEHGRLKERSIAITFDDGLESNYRLGLPVLRELNIPATIYLPTDFINGHMTFWWNGLSGYIKRLNSAKTSSAGIYDLLEFESPPTLISLESDESRLQLFYDVENHLRGLSTTDAANRVARLAQLPVDDSIPPSHPAIPMTWDQIREMSEHGIEFGAHTVSHPNLCYLDADVAEREFSDCKKEIEGQIDKSVRGLAFPYGVDYTTYSKLDQQLQKTGFSHALTAIAGVNDHTTNPFLLRRIALPMTDSPALIGRELLLDFQIDNDTALAPYLAL